MAQIESAFEVLHQRGFVKQSTGDADIRDALDAGSVTFYVGFDPTADSLHVGHLLPAMAMAWMQRCGHRPIVILGGGTAMIGDPSGKTELRQMLTRDQINAHGATYKAQFSKVLDLDGERGMMLDNSEWLMELGYIDFLREIGRHFSVNRMLSAEAYKQRLEKGLSFIEFNYQLLQAYDFLELYRRHGCTLQMGGDDQWGNILAGHDLVRRLTGADVHALTQPLILTASGAKMGKTAKGAVWLSAERCAPFDFFQYWLNVDDRDVVRFLKLYTFLPMDRIDALALLQGADIRQAKRVLAREVTTMIHGADATRAAEAGAAAMVAGASADDLPSHVVDLSGDLRLVALLTQAGMTKSLGEARRLIKNGGIKIDGERVQDAELVLSADHLSGAGLVVRIGKKRAIRLMP
jgi:tyrosyl-tRNA synthetase